MKIAVCVKQVPDSWAEKRMVDSRLDRENVDAVLNDLDEYAVESALQLVETLSNHGVTGDSAQHSVTVISMGPERATEALRKALSMGADEAILIHDAALAGSDALATSKVLAAVIKNSGFDLVFCGTESTDARMSVIPAMLAERLNWAQLTFANSVEVNIDDRTARIARTTESGVEHLTAALPAVIGVVEKINEPRYPSFKGIMAAKKKSIHTLSLSELGIAPSEVGQAGAWSAVREASPKPPRGAGLRVNDEGQGGVALADFLVEKRLI